MLNRITLIGRLGRDPELFNANSGTTIVEMSLATDDGWGEKKKTNWHKVKAFGRLAELCSQYLSKGRVAAVHGRLEYRTWERDDGTKVSMAEVVADEVKFLGGEDGQSQRGGQRSNQSNGRGGRGNQRSQTSGSRRRGRGQQPQLPPAPQPVDDDDIPF